MIRLSTAHVECPKCASDHIDFLSLDQYEVGARASLLFWCAHCDSTLRLGFADSGHAVDRVWTDITEDL